MVWSGDAETALADASFSGARCCTIQGGQIWWAQSAGDVFMYRDFSIAPLLDLRRGFTAVLDVSDGMVRVGVPLSRFIELTVQRRCILRVGPIFRATLADLHSVVGGDIFRFVEWLRGSIVWLVISFTGSWITVGMRSLKIPWYTPVGVRDLKWCLQCKPHLTPGGSGVLAGPAVIDAEFGKAWLPFFCRSGQMEGSLEEFNEDSLDVCVAV